ncbi:MAG: hypothetical protein ACRDKE_07205 [Solirubrobacterales bacterium]
MKSQFGAVGARGRKYLTFSNIVACLALFIALGGASYAAIKIPKNSVGTKQIKKNAVTGAKIKAKTIRGTDLGSNTVTGKQVNEASLAEVPSALSAGSARNRYTILKRVSSSASDNDPNVARAQAAEVPLVSNGQVTLYLKCFDDTDGNSTRAELLVKTNTDGSYASIYNTLLVGNPGLNTNTPEVSRQVLSANASNNDTSYEYGYSNIVLGTDAKGLAFSSTISSRHGNPPDATALYPSANACIASADGGFIE